MYSDPRLIKKHEVKVRLDDDVNELVEALVKNTGGQKSVIVRDIFIEGLKQQVLNVSHKFTAA